MNDLFKLLAQPFFPSKFGFFISLVKVETIPIYVAEDGEAVYSTDNMKSWWMQIFCTESRGNQSGSSDEDDGEEEESDSDNDNDSDNSDSDVPEEIELTESEMRLLNLIQVS